MDVGGKCLISAFDLAQGLVAPDFEALADIIVIDSGVFETRRPAVAVGGYLPDASSLEWTRPAYRSFLVTAAPRMAVTNTVVVSYDCNASLDEQVAQARIDFESAPGAARSFLLKPELEDQLTLPLSVTRAHIEDFDILGVTEIELGRSALDRCRSLLRLRALLSTAGLEIPIHVFGSITPAAVTAYFLCGADIFDGLNWLRVGLDGSWAPAPSEFAVAHGFGALDDHSVSLELWRRNLRALQRTQQALRCFALDGDRGALCAALPFAPRCLALADTATGMEGQ